MPWRFRANLPPVGLAGLVISGLKDRCMSSAEVFEQPNSSPGGPVTREELYAEVWQLPMTKIAEHHGVSSSFLARVCTRMNVPRPPRGHWAKLENGKPSPQPPLPEAGPGDLQVWRRGDVLGPISRPLPRERSASPQNQPPPSPPSMRTLLHPGSLGASDQDRFAPFERLHNYCSTHHRPSR